MVMVKGEQGVGQGTAFLVDHHGTCITNFHVLARASKIELLDDKHSKHHIDRVIHSDEELDFVIFKIDHTEGMEPLYISDKNAEIGEECFAIGNPQGLESTLSTGIISGYRSGETFIQTTTEIAHGSSGGPLFNRSGEVIGITTMAVGESGNLNFAINIKKLKVFLPSLDRNVTLLSPKTYTGNTSLPPAVKDFLLAEEDHDLDAITKCFSPEFYRFWDIVTPDKNKMSKYYQMLWSHTRESRNVIRKVNRVGVGIFHVTMDCNRILSGKNESTRFSDLMVEFELDEDGLIRSVHEVL